MTSPAPAVCTRGLSKSYVDGVDARHVLGAIDLEVAPGEMVAIVGPSGSGKSTLLHILGGLDREYGGQVLVSGVDLSELSAPRLAHFRNRQIGFIFQFHQLLPDFTALENVQMPSRIAGRAAETEAKAAELLDGVGLGDRYDAFPNQLSGGERQRIAICRALLLEPPVLLADEPTGNLDPAAGEVVLELLLELRERQGATCILVTHNPKVAQRCGRVLRLADGTLGSSAAA